MSVQLYEGCFGITRGGAGVASKVEGPWLRTHSDDPGREFSLNGAEEPAIDTRNISGGYLFYAHTPGDIISVRATREEAEAELRRMQGGEGKTLAELDVKPGDVVRCGHAATPSFTPGKLYTVTPSGGVDYDEGGFCLTSASLFTIVSRAPRPIRRPCAAGPHWGGPAADAVRGGEGCPTMPGLVGRFGRI